MKLHSLTAIAAATVFAGAVGAQTPPIGQPTQPVTPSTSTGSSSTAGAVDFSSIDKDADGSVSKKEAASNRDLTKKWDTLDANKDGKLDQGEFAQFEASGSMDSGSGSASGSASGSTSDSSAESDTKAKQEKPKY
jgi:hypothetical protein